MLKLAQNAIDGTEKNISFLEKESAVLRKDPEGIVQFPDTAYFLPLIFSLWGLEIKKNNDLLGAIEKAKKLLSEAAAPPLNLKKGLMAGLAGLVSGEILAALDYENKKEPLPGWVGFIPDTVLRSLGVQLVDGSISGLALIMGEAKDTAAAGSIARSLQERNLLTFIIGREGGGFTKQLDKAEVKMGLDTHLIPLGNKIYSPVYFFNLMVRVALTFGGQKGGSSEKILSYCREKIPGFILSLGKLDNQEWSCVLGGLNFGTPVISETKIPEVKGQGFSLYGEDITVEEDIERLVPRALEARGIKVKITKVPIPVPYSGAFAGERIRKEDMYVEFGGGRSKAFELLIKREMNEIEDRKIIMKTKEIDELTEGKAYHLGVLIEVAGRKMQKDFEPILERQMHTSYNEALGLWHIGARDIIWMRIGKKAKEAGFKLRHLAEILIARIHGEYGAIADKVQVTILGDEKEIEEGIKKAKDIYQERDERLAGMKDEDVDLFYSCLLCQSFAPDHVCIITPERLGLCGAFSWLDGKAAYEINPVGGNEPVAKGRIIDKESGEWEDINRYVKEKSHGKVESVNLYSLLKNPLTSCGCFEAIVAVLPETNGVMAVDREHSGMTPCGMAFSTLAGSVGGGVQTPGFMGVGRRYIPSPKFMANEGGLKRVVWLPKDLKEFLKESLIKRAREIGEPELFDQIADETVGVTVEEIMPFLKEKNHPALKMEPLF